MRTRAQIKLFQTQVISTYLQLGDGAQSPALRLHWILPPYNVSLPPFDAIPNYQVHSVTYLLRSHFSFALIAVDCLQL